MTLAPEFWDKARRVLTAPAGGDRFVALLQRAGLDPAVDLRHGDLRGCDLGGEDLAGYDFTGADLTDARLEGADLSRALGLDTAEGVAQARFDDATRWPRESWADASGRDRFGSWASFTVAGKDGARVTQRLRWCPPGGFLMGSPEDEEGRFRHEGPQQEITFAQGFWMFDTPCTQALWLAVLGGKNPSHFKGPDRPVEQVSFKDAQRFIQRLNRLKPGLSLSLPSEAQWEYACRAGTAEATYAGPALLQEEENTAVLERIAWYRHNSSTGADLHIPIGSALRSEQTVVHVEAGTRPVGYLQANPWGLYDTLGNVWEWCADVWHDSHEGASPDGAARGDSGADLRGAAGGVVRGGAWNGDARLTRAAFWNEFGPAFRDYFLGFRCVRVQFLGKAASVSFLSKAINFLSKATSDKPRGAG